MGIADVADISTDIADIGTDIAMGIADIMDSIDIVDRMLWTLQ